RARFAGAATEKIRHLYRRRTFAQYDVDASRKLDLRSRRRIGGDDETARLIGELLADVAHGEAGVLYRDARLLLRHVGRHRDFGRLLPCAEGENDGGAALLSAAGGRIFLEDNVRRNRSVVPRFSLLRRESRLGQDSRGVLVSLADDVRQNAIVGKNLRRKSEQEHRCIGEKKSAGGGDEIWERTPRKRAPIHLVGPAQPRGERSIGAVALWQHAQPAVVDQISRDGAFGRWLENEIRILGEERIDLGVVFLGLERARAVDEEPIL